MSRSNIPFADAWADPEGYNSGYNYYMDRREALIISMLESEYHNQVRYGYQLIRSGMHEEIEMYGIGKGGRGPLEDD